MPRLDFLNGMDAHYIGDYPQPVYLGACLRGNYNRLPEKTAILNLRSSSEFRDVLRLNEGYPLGRRLYIHFPMMDVEDECFCPTRDELDAFSLTATGLMMRRPTYWHCQAGINRSSFALAYTLLSQGYFPNANECIAHLRAKRDPVVLCNRLFRQKLREWFPGGEVPENEYPD